MAEGIWPALKLVLQPFTTHYRASLHNSRRTGEEGEARGNRTPLLARIAVQRFHDLRVLIDCQDNGLLFDSVGTAGHQR
jgi:hypothetical protein